MTDKLVYAILNLISYKFRKVNLAYAYPLKNQYHKIRGGCMNLERKNNVIAAPTIIGAGTILCAIAKLVAGWGAAVGIGAFFILFLPILWWD